MATRLLGACSQGKVQGEAALPRQAPGVRCRTETGSSPATKKQLCSVHVQVSVLQQACALHKWVKGARGLQFLYAANFLCTRHIPHQVCAGWCSWPGAEGYKSRLRSLTQEPPHPLTCKPSVPLAAQAIPILHCPLLLCWGACLRVCGMVAWRGIAMV